VTAGFFMRGAKQISQTKKQLSRVHSNGFHLFTEFLKRELTNRYLGSAAGILWVFIQPIIKLLIYSFVFSTIFKIRFSEIGGDGFLPFVTIGLWPWLAFSEALQRSIMSVQSSSSLIRKIKFPHEILVLSAVIAVYMIHSVGLFFVFAILKLMGYNIHLIMLPIFLVYLFLQLLMSIGIGFVLSSFQVFLKDVSQIVSSVLMFMFYLTPILYSVTLVPERYRDYYLINPMAFLIGRYRELILGNTWNLQIMDLIAVIASISVLLIGYLLFRRCSRRFEEFI
jgi:lipopolysaccharide transport system permease protein